jgi:hypothetical protein
MTDHDRTEDPRTSGNPEVERLTDALAAPFEPKQLRFKPGVVSGNRALALVYVDARVIQDRLDEVLGVAGWQDEYESLPDGSVVCKLRLRLGSEWITKSDVGGPSEQPDEGDRRKAAFSDALKRAAVKFGIGRYLYRMPSQWVDYDPQKRQFVKPPTLSVPLSTRKVTIPAPAKAPRVVETPDPDHVVQEKAPATRSSALPANGAELSQRLNAYDAQLARQGLSKPGDLVKHVVQLGVKAGYAPDLAAWSGPAISLAVDATKLFESRLRKPDSGRKEVA